MPTITYVMYEQPFDSVIVDIGKHEKGASKGIYVSPVLAALLATLPLAGFVFLLLSKNVPWQLTAGFFAAFLVVASVAAYLFRNMRRYGHARTALGAWAASHGFAAQGRAYVGVVEGRRCAAMAFYRDRAEDDYVLEGFAFILQLNSYTTGGAHVMQKPRVFQEGIELLNAGFEAVLGKYGRRLR